MFNVFIFTRGSWFFVARMTAGNAAWAARYFGSEDRGYQRIALLDDGQWPGC